MALGDYRVSFCERGSFSGGWDERSKSAALKSGAKQARELGSQLSNVTVWDCRGDEPVALAAWSYDDDNRRAVRVTV